VPDSAPIVESLVNSRVWRLLTLRRTIFLLFVSRLYAASLSRNSYRAHLSENHASENAAGHPGVLLRKLRVPRVKPDQTVADSSEVGADCLNTGLHAGIRFDRFFSHMANDEFAEVQRKLEAIASELKNATGPAQRRELLRVMSRLVAEAERISSQPPKTNQ
jgi:hypothetical protein